MLPAETLLIAGPTGAGKTELSLTLASSLDGEIVGADAFQIYRGLPILTAQPSLSCRRGIPHHLIGSVDPSRPYDAGRYLSDALPVIREIAARGKRPIVVGGTGLYFKALLGGLNELPKGSPELRTELQALSTEELLTRLNSLDPEAPAMIDVANRRRVERALEIVLLSGKSLAEARSGPVSPPSAVTALLILRDREELGSRIEANVRAMFAQGVLDEVSALSEEAIGITAAMTLGLREIRSHLRGETSREETISAIVTATRKYAKRQMTWFRNQHDFSMLNLSEFPDPEEALKVSLRLARRGA